MYLHSCYCYEEPVGLPGPAYPPWLTCLSGQQSHGNRSCRGFSGCLCLLHCVAFRGLVGFQLPNMASFPEELLSRLFWGFHKRARLLLSDCLLSLYQVLLPLLPSSLSPPPSPSLLPPSSLPPASPDITSLFQAGLCKPQ